MAKQNPSAPISRAGSVLFIGKASETKSDDNPTDLSTPQTSQTTIRHPEFFFDNTLVAIQIENTLFNVHKYMLVKSEVLSDMMAASKIEDGEPEPGSSPEHPIVIKGASASDFAALLKVLYASHFSSNPPAPETPLIIPAFRLANLLNFSDLRKFLLPLAEKNLDDVDKIVFAREFDIKEWLAPAHVRLCQRENPLTDEEATKLGVGSVLIIWRMREKHRNRPSSISSVVVNHNYCYACTGLTYTGGNYACNGCNQAYGQYANLRYDGPGKFGTLHKNNEVSTTTDNTAIEAGVRKWVEDGCIVKD